MKKRIFSAIFLVAVAIIIAITAITTINFYQYTKSSITKQLQNESTLVMRGVEDEGTAYFDGVTFSDCRVTWINSDGTVKYDSEVNAGEMENHLEREEVKEALEEGYGEATRYSNSIMKQSFYVAYKMEDGSVLRLSCTQNSIFLLLLTNLYPIYIVLAASFVVAIILAFVVSRKIVEPLNKINLDKPLDNKVYPELQPLMERIDSHHKQLTKDKEDVVKASLIRQEFTANVSHELKTPLHVISGYSELIKEGIAKDDDVKSFAGKIYDESTRMSKLVEDIMQLSKLDNGAPDKKKVPLPLTQVCENVVDSLRVIAEKRNINITEHLQDCTIEGIPDVIHSLVYNLVDNAIKYNKDNGHVDVCLEKGKFDTSVLIVSDTGIGIPNDQLDRIFERFYRVDKSHSREIGGTGLGLSIVKHAALIHNAKVEVESSLGEGTTFRITFPGK